MSICAGVIWNAETSRSVGIGLDTYACHYDGDVNKHDIMQNPGKADRSTACWMET